MKKILLCIDNETSLARKFLLSKKLGVFHAFEIVHILTFLVTRTAHLHPDPGVYLVTPVEVLVRCRTFFETMS